MKDSQLSGSRPCPEYKYIKANNERFSTFPAGYRINLLSISRRIMKDSQLAEERLLLAVKYIKANNERFSTRGVPLLFQP